MKRLTLSVVMTGVLGLAAFSISNAQQGGGSPGGGPRGRGPGGPGGFGRGGVAVLRGVDLTDEQKASIKAIHDAERPARTGPPADEALRRELEAEVFADAPDAQKIATLQQQLVQAQAERLAHEIAVQQKVAAVLTAEQRAKVRERLSQAPPERRGGFERRGAGRPQTRRPAVSTEHAGGSPRRPGVLGFSETMPRRSWLACVWIVGLLTIAVRAQQAGDQEQRPPTFRSGTNLVRVDVSVLDKDGKPVRTLNADDFELRENGELQAITSFKLVDANGQPTDDLSLPIRSPQHAATEAARDDVRMFVIFWDEYHIDQFGSAVRAREQLTNFVLEAFGPTDLVALMDQLTPVSALRFTRDRRELANQVHNLRGRRGLYVPARSAIEEAHLRNGQDVERIRSQVTATALKSTVMHLGTMRQGRKAVVFVSETLGRLGQDGIRVLSDLIRTANDNNTAIYTVDPRGLQAGGARVRRRLAAARLARRFDRRGRHRQQRFQLGAAQGGAHLERVLPARLLAEGRAARRQVPRDQGAGEAVRRAGARAQRLLGAARRRHRSRPRHRARRGAAVTGGQGLQGADARQLPPPRRVLGRPRAGLPTTRRA